MPNLRNIGVGRQLLHQVLQQSGSQVKSVTKQVEAKTQKAPKKLQPPTKFSAKP